MDYRLLTPSLEQDLPEDLNHAFRRVSRQQPHIRRLKQVDGDSGIHTRLSGPLLCHYEALELHFMWLLVAIVGQQLVAVKLAFLELLDGQ